MIKFTSNNDFDFAIESVQLVTDNRSLTKRAAAKDRLQFSKTANQEDLHIIALGAYEGTGYNRNGDAFLEDDCRKNHHYFTKANRAVHRHHKNKPADPKFGNIKAAAYNEEMKRIELIVGLDRDKCADILDEQEKTGNTNWSMASKQAYDECSWCHHKAKTDKDRCMHIPAKLGEINKVGEMCGMLNPDPKWFEISYVRRPADRIGMSLGKCAADGAVRPMLPSDFLNLYGDIYVPDDLTISKKAADKRELLHKLAEMEKHVEAAGRSSTADSLFNKRHRSKLKDAPLMADNDIDELRKHEPSKVFRSMADKGVMFNLAEFIKYLFGNRFDSSKVDGVKSQLPGGFQRSENDGELSNNEKYDPSAVDSVPKDLKRKVDSLTEGHSLNEGPAIRRIMQITIICNGDEKKPMVEKTKSAADICLAKEYLSYKLAALNYLNEQGKLSDEVMMNAILQQQ